MRVKREKGETECIYASCSPFLTHISQVKRRIRRVPFSCGVPLVVNSQHAVFACMFCITMDGLPTVPCSKQIAAIHVKRDLVSNYEATARIARSHLSRCVKVSLILVYVWGYAKCRCTCTYKKATLTVHTILDAWEYMHLRARWVCHRVSLHVRSALVYIHTHAAQTHAPDTTACECSFAHISQSVKKTSEIYI